MNSRMYGTLARGLPFFGCVCLSDGVVKMSLALNTGRVAKVIEISEREGVFYMYENVGSFGAL